MLSICLYTFSGMYIIILLMRSYIALLLQGKHDAKDEPFSKRRESTGSLSDDNQQSHDEGQHHSDDSNQGSSGPPDSRRESDVSVTAENDPAAFLYLGPCGRRIL